MSMCKIRPEAADDRDAVFRINAAAFDADGEAHLVDALRAQCDNFISMVAEQDGELVGHILFTPVTLSTAPALQIAGLAPMAVLPDKQNLGIGSQLVRAGLDDCKTAGFVAVIVLGHPEYYPRFGFQPASHLGLRSQYDVPDDVFMAMELKPNALYGLEGVISYHEAFGQL